MFELANKNLYKILYQQAIHVRKNPTTAENVLWQILKQRPLGYKFRRQYIIDKFIIDFYCIKASLIIEVDGPIHNKLKVRDIERDKTLKGLRFSVLRIQANEVINDLKRAVKKIKIELSDIG